jgi:hypothetical protein
MAENPHANQSHELAARPQQGKFVLLSLFHPSFRVSLGGCAEGVISIQMVVWRPPRMTIGSLPLTLDEDTPNHQAGLAGSHGLGHHHASPCRLRMLHDPLRDRVRRKSQHDDDDDAIYRSEATFIILNG